MLSLLIVSGCGGLGLAALYIGIGFQLLAAIWQGGGDA
jgi:hypothetical protein